MWKNASVCFHELNIIYAGVCFHVHTLPSMMLPSQNFLLYIRNIIKMKVTEWIKKFKKYVNPPPLWGYIQHVQIITI